MSGSFTESIVEGATLNWFGELDYAVLHGPQIAPSDASSEGTSSGSRRSRTVCASNCCPSSSNLRLMRRGSDERTDPEVRALVAHLETQGEALVGALEAKA